MPVGGGDDLGSEAQNLDLDGSSVRPYRRFPIVVELEHLDQFGRVSAFTRHVP
jgi:hypothetical protein